jgi:general stress protein 26
MPSPDELTQKLWKSLGADRIVMLGLAADAAVHPRPMTGIVEDGHGPVWFLTASDTDLAQALGQGPKPAIGTFVSTAQDLYATLKGPLVRDDDPAVIDRLWNPFVAAWYDGGRDDPKIALLRFDAAEAEIWQSGSTLVAGIRALLGADLKDTYRDNSAEVRL